MGHKKVTTLTRGEGNSNILIIVAVIALIGTMITAVLSFLKPTGAEIAINATKTAESELTSAAQINSTSAIPIATNTAIADSQFRPLSKDCINSLVWLSLDNETNEPGSDCLLLDKYGIFAKDDGLTISSINNSPQRIWHGVFMPIEKGSRIRLELKISNLYTPNDNDLANLSLGILSKSSYNLETDTLLIYQKESPQQGYPIFIKKEERGSYESYITQDGKYLEYTKNTSQEILLDISDANELTIYIDNSPVIQAAVPFQDKVFWIGYRLSGNCQINAEISGLQIQTQ